MSGEIDEVQAVLDSFVELSDENPQTDMLREAVTRHLEQRAAEPDRPDVRPYLAMATTVELLDELRRRVLNEEAT